MKIEVDGEVKRLDDFLKNKGEKVYKENYNSLKEILEGQKKGFEFTSFILLEEGPEEFNIKKAE